MRILIARTDHLGDMLLTFPMAGLLKQHYPNCTIDILAKDYVKELVLTSPFFNQFISWDELELLFIAKSAHQIEKKKYDAFIAADWYEKTPLPQLARIAKIPLRIIPRHRSCGWRYQLWLSKSRLQHRIQGNCVVGIPKNSNLHRAILNTYLLKPLGIDPVQTTETLLPFLTQLHLPEAEKQHAWLDPTRFNLIVHPGSHGNGHEWPFEYYCQLIQQLPADQFKIFVTGSAREAKCHADYLSQHAPQAVSLMGQTTIRELMHFIAAADGLVASGTGPLHLAGALGIRTLGLYPTEVEASRWRPLGIRAEYTVLQPDCKYRCVRCDCACMKILSVNQVRDRILLWVKEPNSSKQKEGKNICAF